MKKCFIHLEDLQNFVLNVILKVLGGKKLKMETIIYYKKIGDWTVLNGIEIDRTRYKRLVDIPEEYAISSLRSLENMRYKLRIVEE